jgi:hypothetical protein
VLLDFHTVRQSYMIFIVIVYKIYPPFNTHPAVRHLLAVGMVAAVAAGKVAREGIAAGRARCRGVDWRAGSNIVLFLEAAVEKVDVEEWIIGTIATWELDPLRLWERGTAITINNEVGAHGVELTAAHQNDWNISYDK